MATTQTTAGPVQKDGTYTPKRSWNPGLIAGVVAVVLLASSVTHMISDDEATPVNDPTIDSESMSREDITRDLVNRGLVPSQALDPAPISREDIMRDLVNRGLIPHQSLKE